MQINIDGLPLFKSSSSEFWPILCMLDQTEVKDPFVIGLCFGNGKPFSASSYLKPFVLECEKLQDEGLIFNGTHYHFRLSAIICDAPARAFVKM